MTSPKDSSASQAKIKVFVSSISASKEIKQKQARILQVLEARRIPHETVDVATSEVGKRDMRLLMRNHKGVPPQIFNRDIYCGDYDAFYLAVEDEVVEEFLGLPSKKKTAEPASDAATALADAGAAIIAARAKKSSASTKTDVKDEDATAKEDVGVAEDIETKTDEVAPIPAPPPPPPPQSETCIPPPPPLPRS